MSLRTLHLVFITLSTLVAFLFGVWATIAGLRDQSVLFAIGGLASFAGGIILIMYGISFRRKTLT